MPATTYSFIWELGAQFQRVLYLRPGPDAMIEGFTGRMQIRPEADSDDVIVELTTENGRMALTNGSIALDVSHAVEIDTSGCARVGSRQEPDPYGGAPFRATGRLAVFDIELVSPAGLVSRAFSGDVVFSKNVTR